MRARSFVPFVPVSPAEVLDRLLNQEDSESHDVIRQAFLAGMTAGLEALLPPLGTQGADAARAKAYQALRDAASEYPNLVDAAIERRKQT